MFPQLLKILPVHLAPALKIKNAGNIFAIQKDVAQGLHGEEIVLPDFNLLQVLKLIVRKYLLKALITNLAVHA